MKKNEPVARDRLDAFDPIERAETQVWAEGVSKLVWARPRPDMYGTSHPTADTLPPGLYRTENTNSGVFLVQVNYQNDDIVPMPDSASDEVMKEISEFWDKHDAFKKRGLVHKRGVLMCGPQGSGKTSTIAQLVRLIVEVHDGVAIYLDNPSVAASALQLIRRIEPRRPVVCILEDIDALIKSHGESEYLALLDGESQIDHVVFVATTNYPEHLDKRITDRPSRFDLVIEIPPPSKAAREIYLRTKEPDLTDSEMSQWLHLTDGYSIAHLREFMILVRIYGKPPAAASSRLDKMREASRSSDRMEDGIRRDVGFTRGRQDGKRLLA